MTLQTKALREAGMMMKEREKESRRQGFGSGNGRRGRGKKANRKGIL